MGDFRYEGVIPILPTPFLDDERLDPSSLDRLLAFLEPLGIRAVTMLGVLGEASALTDAEGASLLQSARSASPGMGLIAGVSRGGVRNTLAAAEAAASAGADAVMVAPPGPGLSEAMAWDYFCAVSADCPLPLVVQDHPASSGTQLSVRLLIRLVEELSAICGIKCEAVPTAPKLRAIRAGTSRVPILTGLGALYAEADLAAGAGGFNTGFAFPEALLALRRAAEDGRVDDLHQLYAQFLPLIVTEQQPGAAVRKEIWRLRGILSSSRVRTPSPSLDPWVRDHLPGLIDRCLPGSDITRAIAL